jgi:hypothetical protein
MIDLLPRGHGADGESWHESASLPAPEGGRAPCRVIQFGAYRRWLADVERDRAANAEWDALAAAVMRAWNWRDPESLVAVEACVQRLRSLVAEDWDAPL